MFFQAILLFCWLFAQKSSVLWPIVLILISSPTCQLSHSSASQKHCNQLSFSPHGSRPNPLAASVGIHWLRVFQCAPFPTESLTVSFVHSENPMYLAAWIPIAAEPVSHQDPTTRATWDVMLASTAFSPSLFTVWGSMVIVTDDIVSYWFQSNL